MIRLIVIIAVGCLIGFINAMLCRAASDADGEDK